MNRQRSAPAGSRLDALSGRYDESGPGLPNALGPYLHEDWMRYGSASSGYGEVGWTRSNVSGSGGSIILSTPTTAQEYGVAQLRTGSQSGRGSTLHTSAVVQMYQPGIGMVWATKVDMNNTASIEVWSGFSSSTSGRVRVTDSTQFIGIRYLSTEGEWQGVCKNGSTATNESTVSLGSHAAGTYVRFGFEAVDTGGGTLGMQFFSLDTDERHQLTRTLIGDPITDNIPVTTGPLAAGVVTLTGSQRIVYQDWYGYGGRTAR